MRLVAFLLAVSCWGQIGLTMKPWSESDAKDLLGLRKHLPWELSVTCAPGVSSFRRQDVAALISASELSHTASLDVLDKAQKLDGRTLGGKALGITLKAAGAGALGFGAISANPFLVAGGLGMAFGDGVKDVLSSVGTQTSRYAAKLLPDNDTPIPCVEGRGGQWLVLTGEVKSPVTISVPLPKAGPTIDIHPASIITRPMVDETASAMAEETERLARLVAIIRENRKSVGAGE